MSTPNGVPNPEVPDFLRIVKTVRIAVSGDVFLTRLEKEIIDTADFQRLRGVRQLGGVYLVYPTALHTRFDHSLGTLAMAEQMIRAIRDNTHNTPEEKAITYEQEALIRLYALLHDLPHIPFGHTLEDELRIFERHDKNKKRFERFFGPDSAVGGLIIEHLGNKVYERFRAIYQWDGKMTSGGTPERDAILKSLADNDDAFIYDLVSNTVCADLLDYLQRDSFFCNLVLGLEYRFLNFLYLKPDGGPKRVFIRLWKHGHREPRRDTLTDLVRLLEARYIVAERAYFHHAKIISGAMLGRAIQEATSGDGEKLTEEQIYGLSDDTLLHELRNSPNPLAARLADDLAARRLYKTVVDARIRRGDFEALKEHDRDYNALAWALRQIDTPDKRKNLEDRLAAEIDAEPGDVLIYVPDEGMNLKVAEMKVWWDEESIAFKDIDDPVVKPKLEAILEAHRKLWAIDVIAKPGLTDEQKTHLMRSFRIKFLSLPNHRDAEELELNMSLVERRLRTMGRPIPTDPNDFHRRKQEAARLLAAADGDAPFNVRLDGIVSEFFPEQVAGQREAGSGLLPIFEEAGGEAATDGGLVESEFVAVFRSYFGPKYFDEAEPRLREWCAQKLSPLAEDDARDYLYAIQKKLEVTPRGAIKLPQRAWERVNALLKYFEEELGKFLEQRRRRG
jgi:uncharacterized protein